MQEGKTKWVGGGGGGVKGWEKVRKCHVTHAEGVSPTLSAIAYKARTAGAVPLAVAQVQTAGVSAAAAIVLQCGQTLK